MNFAGDPRLVSRLLRLDAASFNAALDGADLRSIEFWASHIVLPRLKPQVVVLGTTSREINDAGEPQLRFYEKMTRSQEGRRILGQESTLDRLTARFESRSWLVRYRMSLRRPAHILKGIPEAQRTSVDRLGILDSLHERHRRPYKVFPIFRHQAVNWLRDFSIGGVQLEALSRLIASLRRMQIPTVLVTMPVTSDLIPLHPRGQRDFELNAAALKALGDPPSVTFVDAAAQIQNRRLFVDPIHLNAEGMRAFTTLVAPAIKQALEHSG